MPESLMNAIQEVKAGHVSSFNEIVRAHQQGIYRLAYRLTGNVEDAKDLTQEVFIRALKGIGGFKGESDIRTWLYRIAINTGSTWRKKNFNQAISLEESGEIADKNQGDVLLQRKISEAVDALPYKQRSVFVMHHYEGYKHEEIARMTDRSLGSVKANYFQAVQKLKEKLKDFAEYQDDQ